MSENRGHDQWIQDALDQAASAEANRGDLPKKIGRFEITDRLGAGGMGIVYLARQKNPSRVVALKIMRTPEMSEKDALRFQYEGELLGRLQHEGIAQVYETGVIKSDGESQPYIAMEHVAHGLPVDLYVSRAHLGPREVAGLLIAVARAVHHAHQRGVVHRDLKPANVLVDLDGRVKVVDFGLARAQDLELSLTTRGTDTSRSVIGSYAYMSPEQLEGLSHEVDARSDVYSLGVIAYRLFGGVHPYVDDDITLLTLAERIKSRPFPLLGQVNRECRGDIEVIVETAMALDPARRYASADALAEDLERYLQSIPIRARRPTLGYTFSRFARRHRGLVAGALIGIVALVVATIMSLESARRAERSRREAVSRQDEAQALKELAFEVASTMRLGDLQNRLQDLWPRRPSMVPALEALKLETRKALESRATIEAALASSGEQISAEETRVLRSYLVAPHQEFEKINQEATERLAMTEEILNATVIDEADTWDWVRESLAEDQSFEGWELSSQIGLVPLDQNPQGLWEFYLYESGAAPAWDEEYGAILDHDSGLVFILVPPGTRRLEKGPIELEPFFLSKYEMTESQWARLDEQVERDRVRGTIDDSKGPLPMKIVSWDSATALLPAWGLALPDHMQWRHAAWGVHPEKTRFIDDVPLAELPSYGCFQRQDPCEVGRFLASSFGFYDLAGNVWELTSTPSHQIFGAYLRLGGSCNPRLTPENSTILGLVAIHPTVNDYYTGIRPIFNMVGGDG